MFDIAEESVFKYGPFEILDHQDDYIKLKSDMTGHLWVIKKFYEDGYPPMVLYHSHQKHLDYHVHCVYDSDNALLCYKEITSHDKLITKRRDLRNKVTSLNNKQLIAAAFA
jgi:hypothetical protein